MEAENLSAPFQRIDEFPTDIKGARLSEPEANAIIRAAEAIEAMAALLYQREIDAEGEELAGPEHVGELRLGHVTACGLLAAIGCCAQLIHAKLTEG